MSTANVTSTPGGTMSRPAHPFFGAFIAMGLLIATGATATVFTAAPSDDDVAELARSFTVADTLNPEPEDDVVLTYPADTFDPNETVEIYLFPGADLLATTTSDEDGGIEETVTIPAGTDVGGYEIVAVDANGNGLVAPITVAASLVGAAQDIDYEQPGAYNMGPCEGDDDTDCIVSLGYFDDDGNLIEGGYLAAEGDPGFTCPEGHIFNVSGSYWNFPGFESAEGGSTILASPSLTTPGFLGGCTRDGARVKANDLVAEEVNIALYSAVNHGGGNYNQASAPKPNCPTGGQCSYGLGPGPDTVFQATFRVSGFAMAYAYSTTADTIVSIESLEDGGAVVTVSGTALSQPGVSDGTSFSEGSLRTADQADFLASTWFFELKNANDPGFPIGCSEFGFPLVSGNHAWGGQPSWDTVNDQLIFGMGAPHLAPDGEPFEGVYEARIPVAYAECLWGIDPASLVTDLEVAVIDEDGTERAEGEFEASITIVDDMLHIDADGFHFSEPDVVVRSTGGFVNLDEPVRILDTRSGDPVGADDLGGDGDPYTLKVTGDTIPDSATAAALNVTVVNGQANDFGGYVSVYPCGTLPEVSNLNFVTGQTIPNSVLAPLSDNGEVCLYVYGQAHLLVDVSGYL